MAKRKHKSQPEARRPKDLPAGQRTNPQHGKTILTHSIGALPIINRLLKRMRLEKFLERHLPPEDNRTKVDTPRVVLLLLRNLLVSREPMYGVAEWACNFGPELFDLWPDDLKFLNDDRVGRCTECVFMALETNLIMDVVTHVVQEFDVGLQGARKGPPIMLTKCRPACQELDVPFARLDVPFARLQVLGAGSVAAWNARRVWKRNANAGAAAGCTAPSTPAKPSRKAKYARTRAPSHADYAQGPSLRRRRGLRPPVRNERNAILRKFRAATRAKISLL